MSNIDSMVIEKKLNISGELFEEIKFQIENNLFFLYLKNFNENLIVDYKEEEDKSILLYIKNIKDESDEELSLIKFKYTYVFENGSYLIKGISDKDYEDEDFFVVDFEDFEISLNKENLIFIMYYNTKKYPKCIITMISNYFELIFLNLERFTNKKCY